LDTSDLDTPWADISRQTNWIPSDLEHQQDTGELSAFCRKTSRIAYCRSTKWLPRQLLNPLLIGTGRVVCSISATR